MTPDICSPPPRCSCCWRRTDWTPDTDYSSRNLRQQETENIWNKVTSSNAFQDFQFSIWLKIYLSASVRMPTFWRILWHKVLTSNSLQISFTSSSINSVSSNGHQCSENCCQVVVSNKKGRQQNMLSRLSKQNVFLTWIIFWTFLHLNFEDQSAIFS